MCACVTHTHPPPLGRVYVCGQGVVGSGNLQSPTLVPELSVTAWLRPISTLDLIVLSQRGRALPPAPLLVTRVGKTAFSSEEW